MDNVSSKRFTFIDLFAGCGGLSLGAMKAGFQGIFAVEYQKNAFETLKSNLIDRQQMEFQKLEISGFDWPNELPITNYDINYLLKYKKDFLQSLSEKVDLVVGGPPCQGFSVAGKRKENDPRNQLYKSYLSFIGIVKPKILLIENVSGIASKFSANGKSYKDQIISKLEKNYIVGGQILSSDFFGVPQRRKRYFIIGFSRSHFLSEKLEIESVFKKITSDSFTFGNNYSLFNKTFNISNTNIVEAIGDLDGDGLEAVLFSDDNAKSKLYTTYRYKKPSSDYQRLMRQGITNVKFADSHRIGDHSQDTRRKYSKLIEISANRLKGQSGFNFNSEELAQAGWNSKKQIVNVLRANDPSPTITTCPFDYIHYNSPRILTVREFARIQSFPDWFIFKGIYATSGSMSYTAPRYTQIGNAVPPLMAECILRTLKIFL